jgi:hypothetical protein
VFVSLGGQLPQNGSNRFPNSLLAIPRFLDRGTLTIFRRLSCRNGPRWYLLALELNGIPGFAALLGEELVGFGVVQELLVVAVPAELAA